MPRKDGREALFEIKQNPEYVNLPVLVLSTSDSEYDKQYCKKLGVYDYVTKPDSYLGLLALVDKVKKVCFF
jgi:CheY-like chemotaxis protein